METLLALDCQQPGGLSMNLRTVQVLLWDLMAPKIREVERDEVERVLGRLVEDNTSLFEEANMLCTILEDLEGEIHESWSKRKLIETPARAMLERDLRKMLSTLKFSTGTSSLSSKERGVYEYLQSTRREANSALRQDSVGVVQRPFTPRNITSRPASSCSTSSRPSTAESTESFSQIALPDVYKILQQVESKLNVHDIDTIAPTLKQTLQAENEALLEDIEYLQQCLQDKSGERTATVQPPSMHDLKDFGKTLQGVSQVDKLLDVSNRHYHHPTNTDHTAAASLLSDTASARSMMKLNGSINSSDHGNMSHLNIIPPPAPITTSTMTRLQPKAPPLVTKPPTSGRPLRKNSCRVRKLRGMVSECREREIE